MSINIAQIGDPILRKPTKVVPKSEINSVKIQKLIDKLIKIMRLEHGTCFCYDFKSGLLTRKVHITHLMIL